MNILKLFVSGLINSVIKKLRTELITANAKNNY